MSLRTFTPDLNTELQLVLLLSYPGAATMWPEQIPRLLAQVDQALLMRLIGFHRVALAVNRNVLPQWRGLLSTSCLSQLEQLANQQQQQIRLQYLQHCRVETSFKEAGISYRFIKGLDLSQRLHQEIGWRYSRDIDILVTTEDEANACEKLKQLGYISEFDALPVNGLGTRVRKALKKDAVFKRADGTIIELHVRLDSANSKLARFMAHYYLSGSKGLSIEEFIYLCFHAAKTKCHRIKWLIDIAFYAHELQKTLKHWRVDAEQMAKKYGVFEQFNLMMLLLEYSFKMQPVNTSARGSKELKTLESIFRSWEIAILPERADWGSVIKSFYVKSGLVDNLKMLFNIIYAPNDHEVYVLNCLPKPMDYLFLIFLPIYKAARFLFRSAFSNMNKLIKRVGKAV